MPESMQSSGESAGFLPISKQTPITIGLVVALLSSIVGFHVYLDSRFDAVERGLERIEERSTDRWTHTSMIVWSTELSRDNPTLHVPAPVPVEPPDRKPGSGR